MQTTLGLLGLFLLVHSYFAGIGREASGGMTRWLGGLCLVGVVLALLMPSWAQTVLLLGVVWNVQRQTPPSTHIDYHSTVLTVAGAYLILIQYSWAWAISYFLWTLALMGTYMGLWALVSVYYFKTHAYKLSWKPPLITWGTVTFAPLTFTIEERGKYDERGVPRPGAKDGDIWCGQYMTNFTQAVFCLTIAATVGLVVTGTTPYLLLTLPFQLFTLVYYLKIHHGIGQWVPHLMLLATATLGLYAPWVAITIGLVGLAGLGWYLWRYDRLGQVGGVDSGRLEEWRDMLFAWRYSRNTWTYLFGFGIRSWVQVAYDKALMKAKTTGKTIHNIFTMAHNEYIQHLFEFGIVGCVALVVYTGQVWWQAAHLHHGLCLVITVMLSIATLSYPWAFYHRAVVPAVGPAGKSTFHEHRFGSPGLFWTSFILAVLAHG